MCEVTLQCCVCTGHCTHKAVQLGYRGLVARVTDVPHLDAALAAGVDMTRRVTNGDSTHHLPVAQSIDLPCVARDARADQCVRGERYRLHLSISAHMKGVGSKGEKRVMWREERGKVSANMAKKRK